jgi:hypothetical protein
MSRELPARPNLEFLKNQAKQLLAELQTANSDAKLADALHVLAREYGFPSWPKLKLDVEARSVIATSVGSPLAGTWAADANRSAALPSGIRSATLAVRVAGDIVTLIDTVIDAVGAERRTENVVQVDGSEYVDERANGYSLMARWLGPRTLEAITLRDGIEVGRVAYGVSADGAVLTITGAARAHNDYPAVEVQTVFRRVSPVSL